MTTTVGCDHWRGGYVQCPISLLRDPQLTSSDRIVWAHLRSRCISSDEAWPTVADLSRTSGIPPRTVKRSVAALDAAGWITRAGSAGLTGRVTTWAVPIPEGQYAQVPARLLTSGLGARAVLVYAALQSHTDQTRRVASPSSPTIARESGIPLRQVPGALRALVEGGWIVPAGTSPVPDGSPGFWRGVRRYEVLPDAVIGPNFSSNGARSACLMGPNRGVDLTDFPTDLKEEEEKTPACASAPAPQLVEAQPLPRPSDSPLTEMDSDMPDDEQGLFELVGASFQTTDKSAAAEAADDPWTPTADLRRAESDSQAKSTDFQSWYARYPRKVGKGRAERAYGAAVKRLGADGPKILDEGLTRYIAYLVATQTGATYTAHPATWIHGERWEDELTVDEPKKGSFRSVVPDYRSPYWRKERLWEPSTAAERAGLE